MKKKRNLKGFTLVELLIVIAVFGLLISGALALIDPISKAMNSTAAKESSAAAIDNIKLTVDGSLRYAQYIDVYTDSFYNGTNTAPTTPKSELDAVKNFTSYYLDGLLTYDGSSPRLTRGKVRVLTIDNSDTDDGKGRVYESIYRYTSVAQSTIENQNVVIEPDANKMLLNPVYFNDDMGYYFSLGSGSVESVGDDIAKIVADDVGSFGSSNFCFNITSYKGSIALIDEVDPVTGNVTGQYKQVNYPYNNSVSALGLVNITSVKNIFSNYSGGYMTDLYYCNKDENGFYDANEVTPHSVNKSFRIYDTGDYATFNDEYSSLSAEINATKNDKIVIIYILPDEIDCD